MNRKIMFVWLFAVAGVIAKEQPAKPQVNGYEQALVAVAHQKKLEKELFAAITSVDTKKVEQLVQRDKISIDTINEVGYTPLLWACVIGSESMALHCIALGANVNHADKNGCSVLMWAIEKKLENVVRELIFKKHVDVHHADHAGKTALMYAAQQNNATVVSWLLAAGAESFVQDNNKKRLYSYLSFYILAKLRLLELAQMKVKHRIHITNPELSCLEKVASVSEQWKKLYALAVTKSTWESYAKSVAQGTNEE